MSAFGAGSIPDQLSLPFFATYIAALQGAAKKTEKVSAAIAKMLAATLVPGVGSLETFT
jgi:hypothetical protein